LGVLGVSQEALVDRAIDLLDGQAVAGAKDDRPPVGRPDRKTVPPRRETPGGVLLHVVKPKTGGEVSNRHLLAVRRDAEGCIFARLRGDSD